jgi:hypothetical protein
VAAAVAATAETMAATAEAVAATETATAEAVAAAAETVRSSKTAASEAAAGATETTTTGSAECRSAGSRRRRRRGPGLKLATLEPSRATLETSHRALGSGTPRVLEALRSRVRPKLAAARLRPGHCAPVGRSVRTKRATHGCHCAVS